MKASIKISSILFEGQSEKEAYLKGCKQIAKFISSKKYSNLTFSVERISNQNQVVFHIFTNIDLNQEQKAFCKICKEFHCSFFINEEYNCSRCNLKTFLKRAENKAKISKGFYKERLNE